MGEQIWSAGSHNIRPWDPVHLLPVGRLCSLLDIQHSQTTIYHSQSNGIMERFHCCLKDTLRARCAAANWVDHLPNFFLSNFLRH